jgi:hypothetical protein
MDTKTTSMACVKCGGEIEVGYLLDVGNGYRESQWAAGSPQRSFLTGIKRPSHTVPVMTFRCRSCGYLESYAKD